MNYPVWEIPFLGGSLLIAVISIVHTYIAHFAVGGGLFLVFTEQKAYCENNIEVLEYVKKHNLFFILLTLVLGAITGVGIWFSISLVNPEATATLLNVFLWLWASEWVLFFVEITSGLVYYYTWNTVDRKTHIIIGWIYAVSSLLTLIMINAILSFMLTPGKWLQTKDFWDACFNPTFLPSLVIRVVGAIGLGGLFAFITASTIKEIKLKETLIKYSAKWLVPSFLLLPIGIVWYFLSIPEAARNIALGGSAPITMFFAMSIFSAVLIFLISYFGVYKYPDKVFPQLAIIILILGIVANGGAEFVREAIRKPYIIYGYMYSNNVETNGPLNTAKWVSENKSGKDIFRVECQICHTVEGYNGIKPLIKGWRKEFLEYQIKHLNELKYFMPPFSGTDDELKMLVEFLDGLNKK